VIVARVRSPLARRYLEAQQEADAFVRYMNLLVIEEAVDAAQGRRAISKVRRLLRAIPTLCRFSAIRIRKLAADKQAGGQRANNEDNAEEITGFDHALPATDPKGNPAGTPSARTREETSSNRPIGTATCDTTG
jgi:hypothetical protein